MHSDRDQQEKRRPDRVLSMLGIAAKAGKIASGEFSAETAVKSGKAYLVITAGDASEHKKKKFRDMAKFYGVPCRVYGDRETLGGCIGKNYRAVLAVTDERLAGAVIGKIASVEAGPHTDCPGEAKGSHCADREKKQDNRQTVFDDPEAPQM